AKCSIPRALGSTPHPPSLLPREQPASISPNSSRTPPTTSASSSNTTKAKAGTSSPAPSAPAHEIHGSFLENARPPTAPTPRSSTRLRPRRHRLADGAACAPRNLHAWPFQHLAAKQQLGRTASPRPRERPSRTHHGHRRTPEVRR